MAKVKRNTNAYQDGSDEGCGEKSQASGHISRYCGRFATHEVAQRLKSPVVRGFIAQRPVD